MGVSLNLIRRQKAVAILGTERLKLLGILERMYLVLSDEERGKWGANTVEVLQKSLRLVRGLVAGQYQRGLCILNSARFTAFQYSATFPCLGSPFAQSRC